MKALRYLMIVVLFLFATSLAHATWIVDTGPGPTDTSGLYYSLNSGQFLAGKFSLSQAYDITGIYGWIYPFTSNKTFTIAVYGDGGQVPDSASQLFSQQVTANSDSIDWYGLSGLSLLLNPGSYWVSFEVRASDVGTMPGPASSPLADYVEGHGISPLEGL